MRKEIQTEKGLYVYEEVKLHLGRKILDPEIAKKNLLDFKKVMDQHKIRYGLMYGTLLGAVREGDFIAYDEDTDVFVLAEEYNNVLNSLFDFEALGFKVARCMGDKRLVTIIRDDEYIDMYFFKKTLNKKRREGDSVVDENYLIHTKTIQFLGELFPIPTNPKQLLCELYGDDWITPRKNGKAINIAFDRKIKNFLIEKLPFLHKKYRGLLDRRGRDAC